MPFAGLQREAATPELRPAAPVHAEASHRNELCPPLFVGPPRVSGNTVRESYFRPGFGKTAIERIGLQGAGEGLDDRRPLERSFGADLSSVRVHTDPRASAACRALGVAGFAVGDDLVFRAPPSRWLLSHEVAHALQQRSDSPARAGSVDPEADADQAASRAASDSRAELTARAEPGRAQAFLIDPLVQARYPRMTAYTRDEIPKVPNDQRIFRAVVDAGRTTEAKVKAGLPWGAPPRIMPRALTGGRDQGGAFQPGTDYLQIHEPTLDGWEKATDPGLIEGYEFTFETTLLHEFVHFLGDGRETMADEWGKEFEEKAHGNASAPRDAKWNLEKFLRPQFPPGTYEVKVTGREAAFNQRFRIAGSTSGDGTFDGTSGKTVTVDLAWGPGAHWNLFIEHDDGVTGWKASRMRKIDIGVAGVTRWLVQSEDWTDRDYNDLEITITQTAPARPPATPP